MLNRATLFATLQSRIDAAVAASEPLGLLIVRTQRLREFNLLFGYAAGDHAVAAMHAVIRAAVHPQDEVVAIGECDFAVIVPGLRNRQHLALAAAKLVRVLQTPLDAGGQEMLASIAVGGAVCPEDSRDADLLCRLADGACDEALGNGDHFALHQAAESAPQFAHGDLRVAIAGNQLRLFLQPIQHLGSGRIDRAEALSRWTHAELGAIPPDVFIRVAEQTGLIGELTRWNINAVLRHAADALGAGEGLIVSINLSVWSLQQSGFVEQVQDLVRLWNIAPERVVLEVTESGLMGDMKHCARVLQQLRDASFGIAIDDFGTGYSSMAYLKRLPVTELKIDKSFVMDMASDVRMEKLVGSMIDLSHHMGLEVVAEGVEDAATLQRLRDMGCDFAQGYHIARPAPAAEVVAQLQVQDR